MEGIRQEDIYPLLRKHFIALFEHRHGAFMRFVCTHPELGPAFDVNDTEARRHLEFLIANDDCAVRYGVLEPLEIWGIYRPLNQPSLEQPPAGTPAMKKIGTPVVCEHRAQLRDQSTRRRREEDVSPARFIRKRDRFRKGLLLRIRHPGSLASLCSRNSTVIDVGANGGAHTKTMAEAVGPDGRVIAFEPDQRILNPTLSPCSSAIHGSVCIRSRCLTTLDLRASIWINALHLVLWTYAITSRYKRWARPMSQ
jgi:hypothetical protein